MSDTAQCSRGPPPTPARPQGRREYSQPRLIIPPSSVPTAPEMLPGELSWVLELPPSFQGPLNSSSF